MHFYLLREKCCISIVFLNKQSLFTKILFMVSVNLAICALLLVNRAEFWSALPGGCGPVSHSCTALGKIYNIHGVFLLAVCFALQ